MKIAVMQFPGTNCEFETLVAVKEVGMEGEIFRWNRPEGELSCFDGFIIPGKVQLEGKKVMDSQAFSLGLHEREILLG